jgi:hypothetical protein
VLAAAPNQDRIPPRLFGRFAGIAGSAPHPDRRAQRPAEGPQAAGRFFVSTLLAHDETAAQHALAIRILRSIERIASIPSPVGRPWSRRQPERRPRFHWRRRLPVASGSCVSVRGRLHPICRPLALAIGEPEHGRDEKREPEINPVLGEERWNCHCRSPIETDCRRCPARP